MKISFTSLRTKAILAVTLIVGSVLGGTGLTYFAVRQQRAALRDRRAEPGQRPRLSRCSPVRYGEAEGDAEGDGGDDGGGGGGAT